MIRFHGSAIEAARASSCPPRQCRPRILIRIDPEGLSFAKSPARRCCWNDSGGGAGVAIAGLNYWGNFQAKGTANRGKPLSAQQLLAMGPHSRYGRIETATRLERPSRSGGRRSGPRRAQATGDP
jgi:hypothetical protein